MGWFSQLPNGAKRSWKYSRLTSPCAAWGALGLIDAADCAGAGEAVRLRHSVRAATKAARPHNRNPGTITIVSERTRRALTMPCAHSAINRVPVRDGNGLYQ